MDNNTPPQKTLKETQLAKVGAIPVPVEKNTYSFEELWKEKDFEQKFLIPELIPKATVCVLFGEDGIGKTQITTQLCLSICFGFNSFMGLQLNSDHKRCLICATEDSRQKFTKAIVKQASALKPNLKPSEVLIQFTEGSNFDTLDLLMIEIYSLLKKDNFDLIVIDALSDLFTMIDGEINQNSHARKILSKLQNMCNTFQVTLVLIHHAAKSKIAPKQKEGKIFLDKFDSQGAGAITQKPRTILALSNDPQSVTADGTAYTNYLHVVKANLMSKHYVTKAIKMGFNGHTLLHTYEDLINIDEWNNENVTTTTEAGQQRKPKPDEVNDETHDRFLDVAFADQTKTYNREDFIYECVKFYGVGINKITSKGGYLHHLIDAKKVESVGGMYYLPDSTPF